MFIPIYNATNKINLIPNSTVIYKNNNIHHSSTAANVIQHTGVSATLNMLQPIYNMRCDLWTLLRYSPESCAPLYTVSNSSIINTGCP